MVTKVGDGLLSQNWPELQKKMIEAMNQLEDAIRPEIQKIL